MNIWDWTVMQTRPQLQERSQSEGKPPVRCRALMVGKAPLLQRISVHDALPLSAEELFPAETADGAGPAAEADFAEVEPVEAPDAQLEQAEQEPAEVLMTDTQPGPSQPEVPRP